VIARGKPLALIFHRGWWLALADLRAAFWTEAVTAAWQRIDALPQAP
jgi:hypothetical protein